MKEKFREAIANLMAEEVKQTCMLNIAQQILNLKVDGCRLAIVKEENHIDIPDQVFFAPESKACGFSKRSFLEAGWVQEVKE